MDMVFECKQTEAKAKTLHSDLLVLQNIEILHFERQGTMFLRAKVIMR